MDVAGLTLLTRNATPTPTPPDSTPPNRFAQIWGFIGVFLPMATVAIVLRLVSRAKFSYISADDITMVMAYLMALGGVAVTVIAKNYGMGTHIQDVDPLNNVNILKCGFASQVTYPAFLGLTKVSILLFLSRVIPSTSLWRKRIWMLIAFIVCQETAFTVVLVLQCQPVSYFWDRTMEPPGKCIHQAAFYYVDASVNIFTDVVILSLPWLIFSSLRIPRRKKYALLGICSAGCFTLVSSIARLPFLKNLSRSKDPTWEVVDVSTWSIAEGCSAITTASVPVLRPLVTWIFPKFVLSTTNNYLANGGDRPLDRDPESFAMPVFGGRKKNTQIEIGGRTADNGSEEYILNEDGRVIRQTVTMKLSSETLPEEDAV